MGIASRAMKTSRHLLHRPQERFCGCKCPHCPAVRTEALEKLVFRDGDVSTRRTHKATVSRRSHQHEVINRGTIWATRLFDHGWLLGGEVGLKLPNLTLELSKRKRDQILRSTFAVDSAFASSPRTSSRAGVTPAEVQRLFTAHFFTN